jgi:hypothetical protein
MGGTAPKERKAEFLLRTVPLPGNNDLFIPTKTAHLVLAIPLLWNPSIMINRAIL